MPLGNLTPRLSNGHFFARKLRRFSSTMQPCARALLWPTHERGMLNATTAIVNCQRLR